MLTHGFSPALVTKVQSIIDKAASGGCAPLSAYKDICDVLTQEKVLKRMVLTCDAVACHPSNREGCGLNPHNVHRNGSELVRVGCDPHLLTSAVCIELAVDPVMKSKQLAFNRTMVEQSAGLLAPLNGSESMLSLGTGHTTAFLRALKNRCITPVPELAGEDGCLRSESILQKDARLKEVLENGFGWLVFPWAAEVAWPALPALVQRALNSSHGVSSLPTELSVMSAIAELDRLRPKNQPFANVLKSVLMSSPACAPYLEEVGKLTCELAGGHDAPLVHLLDRFGKLFGQSKVIGEEVIRALTELRGSELCPITFGKVAVIATNLTAPKIVDGVAKLLTKTDVEKCRGSLKTKMYELSEAVRTAHSVVTMAREDGRIEQHTADILLGKFMVRSTLLMMGKQSQGAEKKQYKDQNEIVYNFVNSLRSECSDTHGLKLLHWADVPCGSLKKEEKEEKEEASQPIDDVGVRTLKEQDDTSVLLKKRGFVIGAYCKERGVQEGKIYQISGRTAEGSIVLVQWTLDRKPATETVTVALADFLKGWVVHSSQLPTILPLPEKLPDPAKSKVIWDEFSRFVVFKTLKEFEQVRNRDLKFKYMQFPNAIMADAGCSLYKLIAC